jgi:hypothetical protein
MKQNETNLGLKSPINYICEFCDFKSFQKSKYNRHLSTLKHEKRTNETNLKQDLDKKSQCFCGKSFTSRTTMWRHKKKCTETNFTLNENKINLNENSEIPDKELIMMLIKQNSELVEVLKNGTHTTSNSHNNINSLNKTFNLQFFLNETCKDAMNIMDFVDSIKLQLSDLENVGKIGYVEGISSIIDSNLKALDVTQRPIHCTDKKREVLYIKDEDKWEKENDNKTIIRKAIKHISNKNTKLIPIFREKHPDCNKSISKYSDQYNKLIIEAMGGYGDNDLEKEDKIIKNISKNVTIDKEISNL